MLIDLANLEKNQVGIIREFKCAHGMCRKFENIGIRNGKNIEKISGQKTRGPQIIKIDNLQIAIGYGMAKHIFVEVEVKS